MNKIIIIFLLFLFTWGYPQSATPKQGEQENGMQHLDKNSFLTSSIVGDQLYLSIPEHMLDKPVLFVRYDHSIKRKFLQVIWSLEGDKILLKVPSIHSSAGIILPVKPKLTIEDNLLGVFTLVNKENNRDSYTINITDLVLHEMIEWEPGFTENLVPQITLLLDAKNLENEVIIKTRRGLVIENSKIAAPTFYGFCALPSPMKPRRFDYRMGFYDEEISGDHFWHRNRLANISRWRLEKKFKDQKISVPIKPITFLISPEVPKQWRPYIKKGIEDWLPAFEAAGFRDALVVKEMDSLDEWQSHSIHSNIVYWSKNKYMRGSDYEDYGGTVAKIIDLRSGEILRGDIFMGASERTLTQKYFIRAAPLDKRAQTIPFPNDLVGELFRVVAAHEVGHSFGIMDGNYGEYTYPWDKISDSLWLRTMGHTPSIMNYTRSSNIPQPEDSIPPNLLLQKVGPTDKYNIQWAYTEFPEGTMPEEEQDALEHMIRWQDSVPWYRFNISQLEVMGPAASDEVVETNDPVKSTELALKNVKRVIELLPQAISNQIDNDQLKRLYGKVLELWYHHMSHVGTLIGGYEIHYKSINQPGNFYTPIPMEAQEEALDFLIMNAFNPPNWLIHPEFEAKTRYSTFPDQVVGYQQKLMIEMIDPKRMKRLEQLENLQGRKGSLQKYLTRLQLGLFKELRDDFEVNSRNQEIQMTYIDMLLGIMKKERLNFYPETKLMDYTDYSRGLLMQQLLMLAKDIERGIEKNKEAASLGHWQLCLKKINAMP